MPPKIHSLIKIDFVFNFPNYVYLIWHLIPDGLRRFVVVIGVGPSHIFASILRSIMRGCVGVCQFDKRHMIWRGHLGSHPSPSVWPESPVCNDHLASFAAYTDIVILFPVLLLCDKPAVPQPDALWPYIWPCTQCVPEIVNSDFDD